jgi:hypothetical protein
MVKQVARRADAVARLLPDTDARKATIRADIARLGNECGCALGGVFLVVATVLVTSYAVAAGELGVWSVARGVLVVLAASMLGKLAGILIAVARLTLLRRRLVVPGVGRAPRPRTAAGGA